MSNLELTITYSYFIPITMSPIKIVLFYVCKISTRIFKNYCQKLI